MAETICLISLVDTYSRVASFHISDTENSLGVARAVAKYILKYGKPKIIKGDNGKAFLSKYTQAVMNNLDIEYKNVRAYSGWLKPYVENTFRALQDRVIAWGRGYIGHNVSQRQAIEFFFSKKERRLKRGAITNLKELDSFNSMLEQIDIYTDTLLNNRYIDDLGCTPRESYNAKASQAVAMNEYELAMKLSPSIRRKVNKEGIMHGGVWYKSVQAFQYNNVIVRLNINNSRELFIYNEQGEFVEIAQCIDTKGVSAEEAKMSKSITLKRIKRAQKSIEKDRRQQEEVLSQVLTAASKNVKQAQAPVMPQINNINIQAEKLKNETMKMAACSEFRAPPLQEYKREDLSFEAAVLKKRR